MHSTWSVSVLAQKQQQASLSEILPNCFDRIPNGVDAYMNTNFNEFWLSSPIEPVPTCMPMRMHVDSP